MSRESHVSHCPDSIKNRTSIVQASSSEPHGKCSQNVGAPEEDIPGQRSRNKNSFLRGSKNPSKPLQRPKSNRKYSTWDLISVYLGPKKAA